MIEMLKDTIDSEDIDENLRFLNFFPKFAVLFVGKNILECYNPFHPRLRSLPNTAKMKSRAFLTHAEACAILATIQTILEQQQKGAAVAVTDAHGELIAFLRTDGCPLPSISKRLEQGFYCRARRHSVKRVGQCV